jgi:hypothetical protein
MERHDPGAIPLTCRNATVPQLHTLLEDHRARSVDFVAATGGLRAEGGKLIVIGAQRDARITSDGVFPAGSDLLLTPTSIADTQIGEKLSIPPGYLGRCRTEDLARDDVQLWDASVNYWLTSTKYRKERFLVRALIGDDPQYDVARAFLSDGFMILDCLDVLLASLAGIQEAGLDMEGLDFQGCDLTESKMYVRINAPQISVMAPALFAGYVSPFTGDRGADNPVVSAGLTVRSSDVGRGKAEIAPYITSLVCGNGMTITRDAQSRVHLGTQLSDGDITPSEETRGRLLALIVSQTKDAVRKFLSPSYIEALVKEMEAKAAVVIHEPDTTVIQIGKSLGYTKAEQAKILEHFYAGHQQTAGGFMHAVTSFAQLEEVDVDRARSLQDDCMRALTTAAAIAR